MSTSEAEDSIVEAWTTKHSDPKFQTDLWFIVTENGEEIRIPGCSVILRMHSGLVQGLPMGTDDELHVPAGLGDHDARTVVLFLSLCYPPLSTVRPFDELYERALSDPAPREHLFNVIPKLAKFAHWCDAPAVLDRLQYVMIQLTNKHKKSNFRFSKAFFVAVFALHEVGRGIALDDHDHHGYTIAFVFPDIYIKMNDEERKRFAGHALRMFEGFLEYGDLAKTASGSYDVSARLVRLARFLLSFGPKPRRSIATQTDAD